MKRIAQFFKSIKDWALHPNRRHIWSKTKIATSVLLGAFLALIVLISLTPLPNTWIGIKATSEYAGFRVTRPEFVAFRVGGMTASGLEEGTQCVDGLVSPREGSWVELRRGDKTDLSIMISPGHAGAAGISNGVTEIERKHQVVFTRDAKCPGTLPTRFPIAGPAVFGHQPEPANAIGVPPDALLKGKIEVYAFSHSWGWPRMFPKSIYLLSDFDIPPGAVVCADIHAEEGKENSGLTCNQLGDAESEQDGLRTWVGVATPATFDNGLDVAASSSAPGLVVELSYLLGRESVSHVDLGSHEQFYRDPNLLLLQVWFGAALLILHMLISVLEFFSKEKTAEHTT